MFDVERVRKHFPAIRGGRIVTNNAATTQPPDFLLDLHKEFSLMYENVHRGQSSASVHTTRLFENAYKIVADFIGAKSWREIVFYRGTTEAINSVMYSLMTEFKDGDNVVTTYLEHNSNYVPWYGLTKEILPKFGVNVDCRLAKFDKDTGEIDLDHLAELVDKRTKIVCCTGASNFLGTKQPIEKIRKITNDSGYKQPNGINRSYLLIDGAQLIPNSYMDVVKQDIDFLAWSFHKMLCPFGSGALYAKQEILESIPCFQYGGDMIAEGEVTPKKVGYNDLPWKFTAGTPNILGTIIAGEATKFLVELGIGEDKDFIEIRRAHMKRHRVKKAMDNISNHGVKLGKCLIDGLTEIPDLTLYGPTNAKKKTSLTAFNIKDKSAFDIANKLTAKGIESRAGCHCATLAHYFYGINPPASCRVSPYFYNTLDEMEHVVKAVEEIAKS